MHPIPSDSRPGQDARILRLASNRAEPGRPTDGTGMAVGRDELLLDVAFAFAIVQVSVGLVHALSPIGAAHALILAFASWLAWQAAGSTEAWPGVAVGRVRPVLLPVIALSLVMAAAIPTAFGQRGPFFAVAYAAIGIGRLGFALREAAARKVIAPGVRRRLPWLLVPAALWLGGGFVDDPVRSGAWLAAVAFEMLRPMLVGGALRPLLRRDAAEADAAGGSDGLVQRQLEAGREAFVLSTLGGLVVGLGVGLSADSRWGVAELATLAVGIGQAVALWRLYRPDRRSHQATRARAGAAVRSLARFVPAAHAVLLLALSVEGAGFLLAVADPQARMTQATATAMLAGPVLFVVANALIRRTQRGAWPGSHLGGAIALGMLAPAAFVGLRLTVLIFTTLILLFLGVWENHERHRPEQAGRPPRGRPGAGR